MKVYTFDDVYEAKVAELTDAFIDRENREPTVMETVWISGEARQYAKEFMEHYQAWLEDHDERDRKFVL